MCCARKSKYARGAHGERLERLWPGHERIGVRRGSSVAPLGFTHEIGCVDGLEDKRAWDLPQVLLKVEEPARRWKLSALTSTS